MQVDVIDSKSCRVVRVDIADNLVAFAQRS